MANATAEKKPAAKKAEKAEKTEAAPKKETTAVRPQRVTARVNLTTAKTIEAQFDTTGKKIEDLDKKLVEIERKSSTNQITPSQ